MPRCPRRRPRRCWNSRSSIWRLPRPRDAAKVASFYAEDAVVMPPNAPPIEGRRAIQRDHERLFKESPPFELTATPLASETSGDLGYIRGEYVVRRQGSPDVRGKYVEVWRRINGEWKIICDINNANHAPAAPTPPGIAAAADLQPAPLTRCPAQSGAVPCTRLQRQPPGTRSSGIAKLHQTSPIPIAATRYVGSGPVQWLHSGTAT